MNTATLDLSIPGINPSFNSFFDDLLSVEFSLLDFSFLSLNPVKTVGTQDDDLLLLLNETQDNSILAGGGSDAIVVQGKNNLIVATDAQSRGRFETDYVSLGAGTDTVFLGDIAGSYYTENGWLDSLYIDGFELETDRLVLFGNSALYQVESTTEGSWILSKDGESAIAYINGLNDLDLNDSALRYTDQLRTDLANVDASDPTIILEETLAFYQQLGAPRYTEIVGSPADDQLLGSGAADKLAGFGGNDYAYGGAGQDLFVLGDFGGSYYAQQGWQDSLYIEDFAVGVDQLQLQGSVSEYATTTTETGLWLYQNEDPVAYLKNVRAVDLDSFEYLKL